MRRKHLLLAVAYLFFQTYSIAQTSNETGWKYAESITEQQLQKVLTVIASDQMEGRETGTEGQRRAAIYISNQFQKIGLKTPPGFDSYEQKYPLYRDTVVSQQFSVRASVWTPFTDYILMPGNASSLSLKNNQIVFAGYGIDDPVYSDYKGLDVKGKVVVILEGEPMKDGKYVVGGGSRPSAWAFSMNRKLQAATRHGAVAVIIANPQAEELPGYLLSQAKSSNLYYPRPVAVRVPLLYVMPSVLEAIFTASQVNIIKKAFRDNDTFESAAIRSAKEVEIAYGKKRYSVLASNVLGYIEGSDLKDEYVVLTAHYDHLGMHDGKIYYGADDDGSGTTAVIEIARAFKKAKDEGNGPRRSVVFMTVSGEEKGLWGSEYYSEHPVFPLAKTTANLNIDMIGRLDPNRKIGDSTNYIYVIGNDKLSTDLDPLVKQVNDRHLQMELDFKFNDPDDPERIYFRSDHYNFARKGVPVLFYFSGIHADYHRPSDTVDKINFDVMLKRVQYIFMTTWEVANRDKMLKRDLELPTQTR